MSWLNLSLTLFGLALLLTAVFTGSPKRWVRVRPMVALSLQVGGAVLATLALVTLIQLASSPGVYPVREESIPATISAAALNSLPLLALAAVWGPAAGLGAAFLLLWSRRSSSIFGLAAAVLWAVPTFLLAIAAQELQAQIYNYTSLAVGGAYGAAGPWQVFWAAVVLGLRPAAYVFQRSRIAFEAEAGQDYVRAARARGLSWRRVARKYILRPALPIVVSGCLISLRLMVGSLPLVEFFFAYPGLGGLFVHSLGLGSSVGVEPDLAIASIALLAAFFFVTEAGASFLQQYLDPRLSDLRLRGEPVA